MNQKCVTLEEWSIKALSELQNGTREVKNDHINIFADYPVKLLKPLDFLQYICNLMVRANFILKNSNVIKPYIYIHIGYSNKIRYWKDAIWKETGNKKLNALYQPPSLGFYSFNQDFLGLKAEEYKCPVDFPAGFIFQNINDIFPVFRCYRFKDDGWDFSSGIYLFRQQDI